MTTTADGDAVRTRWRVSARAACRAPPAGSQRVGALGDRDRSQPEVAELDREAVDRQADAEGGELVEREDPCGDDRRGEGGAGADQVAADDDQARP